MNLPLESFTPPQRREPGSRKGLFPVFRPRHRSGNSRKGRPGVPRAIESTSHVRNFHLRSFLRALNRFRHGSLSHWTTTIIIALSLTIHGCFLLLLTNADAALSRWKGDNRVTLFLEKGVSVSQLTQIGEQLQKKEEIQHLTLVTPEAALQRMKSLIGGEAEFLGTLTDNPLPHSFEFEVPDHNSEHTVALVREIGSWPGVEAVSHDQEWTRKLVAMVEFIRIIGIGLLVLLLSAVALIISNTIKLTIIARRDEIEVMRFMGATDMFIKVPFIHEGVIQGVFGALGALALIFILYQGAGKGVLQLAAAFDVHPILHFLTLPQGLFLFCLGIGLGLIGALISLSRFLEI
ncbi:MAG: ABC transporter permease [Magnetococcales bacterium]|nr:ABC transporter permease [Magnetococcales bacterium]